MLGGKPCCASMPLIAVLVGLGMFAVVGVRKWLNASAREAAKARSRDDRRAHPLAVLLEHHDIDDQVCTGRCWSVLEVRTSVVFSWTESMSTDSGRTL